MKTYRLRQAAVALALIAAISCASAQLSVYRSLATTATTVDTAMSAYGDLVRAGKVSAATQAKVKQAYADYQLAMVIAEGAYRTWKAAGYPSTGLISVQNAANDAASAAGKIQVEASKP